MKKVQKFSTNQGQEQEQEQEVSKSQRKREMTALQKLGEKLSELNTEQIKLLPITDRLREALFEVKRISKHEAKRRQMQFIGRLMAEEENAQEIEAVWQKMTSAGRMATKELHLIEQWREKLLTEGKQALTELIAAYQPADIQHLRHLVLQAQNEKETGKPVGSARALFRYLKELMASSEQDNDL